MAGNILNTDPFYQVNHFISLRLLNDIDNRSVLTKLCYQNYLIILIAVWYKKSIVAGRQ